MVNQLMPLIGGFIGLIIILGVGTLILGNSTMNCSTLTGFNLTLQNNTNLPSHTGWALACVNQNTSAQSGYALLVISVIVFAAVIILSIVRMLG